MWEAIIDIPSRTQFSQHINEAEISGDGTAKLGNKVNMTIGSVGLMGVKIREIEPHRRLVLGLKMIHIHAFHTYEMESLDPERQKVTIRQEYGRIAGSLFAKMTRKSQQARLQEELKAIAARAAA